VARGKGKSIMDSLIAIGDPLTTIALGIIANFSYNFIRGHKIADRAFDGLKKILFGDAETVSDLKDRQWARLYSHADLVSKVKVYQKATNRIHSLLELVETFDNAISQNEPSLKGKIDEALNYLRTDEKAYSEIIHRLQLNMLWEILRRYPSPEALKKREEDVLRDYGEKLRKRCQKLDLFGVRGASDVGVQLENIKETKVLKKGSAHLLLLADIVIQGTPVTDFFKSMVLKHLYETCREYGELSGGFADRLGKLGDYELNEQTYTLLEKDIVGTSDEERHWSIRYFSIRNDLIKTYIKQFERTVEPYVEDNRVRECLLPLLGDLKRLAAPILRFADIETLITPWYLPPILLFYYRYLMEGEQFFDSSYVLEKLSAGMFVYSSRLAFLALTLALALDRDRAQDRTLARFLDRNLALALERTLARARARALDPALALNLARIRDLVLPLALNQILLLALDRARTLNPDWNWVHAHAIATIDDEALFHGTMIHMATLLEFLFGEGNEPPSHLTHALEKQPDPPSPYVRAAQLFRRFIRREITPEEELEFQRLLNIEDEEVRHIFDLAYLTDPKTREPIFRFRTKLEST
jgi:hypothetical protein